MKRIDYSEEAIERRIVTVAQLRNLCLSLAKAGAETKKKLSDDKEHEERPPTRG